MALQLAESASAQPSTKTHDGSGDVKAEENNSELNLSLKELRELPSTVLRNSCLVTLKLSYNNLTDLPLALCEACGSSLQHLIVKGNSLKSLPKNIGLLKQLVVLDASENNISRLPESITDLQRLEKLRIIGNRVKCLPPNISELIALQDLHLDENQIRKLPSTFGDLGRLQRLEINNNRLKELCENFGDLASLLYLDVSYNKLKTLPESIKLLASLEELDLSHNNLRFLPEVLACAPRLRKLYADNNYFFTLPQWFSQLNCLEELSLEDNQLQYSPFPADFGALTRKLKHFDLAANFMSALPESFGEMTNLEYVHLGSTIHELERRNFQNGNWLPRLPANFGRLTLLKFLRLDENQLVELPESFGELVSLETLDLGQNKLVSLPENFGKLRSLRICLLSKNFLHYLPSNFGELQSLVELKLDNNVLTELPESCNRLTQLQTLDLFNNQLTDVPQCLQFMASLKYLELDENKFGVSEEEVPRIFQRRTYSRNSQMKGNWRDRGRQDLDNFFLQQSESGKVGVNGDVDVAEESEAQVSNLVTALKQGSAMWRSHGAEGERTKFDHNAERANGLHPLADRFGHDKFHTLDFKNDNEVSMSSTDEESDTTDSEKKVEENWSQDEEMWDVNENPPAEPDLAIVSEPKEDWDAEIEKEDPYHMYDDFPLTERVIRGPLWMGFHKRDAFCPADSHAKPILRISIQPKKTAIGQFDDADVR